MRIASGLGRWGIDLPGRSGKAQAMLPSIDITVNWRPQRHGVVHAFLFQKEKKSHTCHRSGFKIHKWSPPSNHRLSVRRLSVEEYWALRKIFCAKWTVLPAASTWEKTHWDSLFYFTPRIAWTIRRLILGIIMSEAAATMNSNCLAKLCARHGYLGQ